MAGVWGVLAVTPLGAAALLPDARLPTLVILTGAYVASRWTGRSSAALAAVLPGAAILAWGVIPQPAAGVGGAQCADIFSPPAMYRLAEVAIAVAITGVLLVDRRASPASIGLRWASRRTAMIGLAAFLLIGPAAVLLSTAVGGLFFGAFALDLARPGAIIPALVFAGSNALAEELSYRGAMRTWLTPSLGVIGANLAQAVIFGLAHTGGDFVGPAAPVVVSMIGVGFLGGIVARRTGSLVLVLAVHAAADIPIYLYWACRVVP